MDKKELEKRKLIRLVAQGEAINVKQIFHAPVVRDGLREILGNRDGDRAYEIMKNMTKAAGQKDWLIPYEHTIGIMSDMDPFGLTRVEYED